MLWSTLIRQLVAWLLFLNSCFGYNNTGLTDLVEWDSYSLVVNKERVFILSGEFHYQRLPVPELWLDVFQKFKANGLNSVSIYFFWSYHSPAPDTYDLETGAKNVQKVLDYAKKAGLYVLARPGPYCNAETSSGGIALWATDGSAGGLRTADETYHQAWLPWARAIGAVLERNQITHGGPVILQQIENEFQETVYSPDHTTVRHMIQIEEAFRDAGIVVPFFHNEKGFRSISWSTDYNNVGGAVNIYGLDSYPGGLDCANPNTGFNVVRTYYQWFHNYSWTQPELLPEYRGGWFNPWGGGFYDQCVSSLSPEYGDVFYKTLLGQRVTLLNFYMTFGGTNWGHSAAPVVYSSYDYSAPLRETREVREKFKQIKTIGLFTRVSSGLLKTVMESNGTGNAVDTQDVHTFVVRNPDTGAGFYIADHSASRSRDNTTFGITVNTTIGPVKIPKVELLGRQSRIIVNDYPVGEHTLLYSAAEILTWGVFEKTTVLVFYLNEEHTGEFALKSAPLDLKYNTYGSTLNITSVKSDDENFIRYTYVQPKGQSVIVFANGLTVYLLDKPTAYSFWAPPTTNNPTVHPDEQIFAIGPYLVRSASTAPGVVEVSGDNSNTTSIEVFVGDQTIDTISWNGKRLHTERTPWGSLSGIAVGASDRKIQLPEFTWKVADSLPEKQRNYDDSTWVDANHTTTISPQAPLTWPVLFASEYGYYTGIVIYRARFDGKGATGVNLTAQGGDAAGWNAWLNGQLIGGFQGEPGVDDNSAQLNFLNVTLFDEENVLTVVTDYHGHDQTSVGPNGPENPRGLLGATLLSSSSTVTFTKWKIQGAAGGNQAYIDPVRGPQNEGGLYGERLGWHLPEFDTHGWESGSPLDGVEGGGINWYITDFDLDIDRDLDVPLGIEFSATDDTVARVQLFVNGYQYGKYVPHIGPQTRFPIPPGIINLNGHNRLALSVWSQTDVGAKLSNVKLFAYEKYQTSFDIPRDHSNDLQPKWTQSRLAYA